MIASAAAPLPSSPRSARPPATREELARAVARLRDPGLLAARRQRVMDAVGPAAVVLVASLPERPRNGDSFHRFRQHSDVLYLTGFAEPETAVLLRPGAAPAAAGATAEPGSEARFVMFVRPSDPEAELWDGKRLGIEGARAELGADVAFAAAELESRLSALIANFDDLHYAVGLDPQLDAAVLGTIARLRKTEKRGKRPPRAIIDPMAVLHEHRLHKGPEELEVLRHAADITARAHVEAMRLGRPGTSEAELEAAVDYAFRRLGGSGPGYNSIVGAGPNATILHYIDSRDLIRAGELVLVDAGCELGGYTADVTRTFPADGTFTTAQREVYELVLKAQVSAIAMVRPGVTIDQLHQHCVRVLTEGLLALGLLSGSREDRIADGSYRRFFPHGTSHWLGLDVHDAGAYTSGGAARPLAPGMVITVEPGLYLPAAPDIPEPLRGLGVRIEDDVLVTADGCEVLTAACPKTVEEVEAACRS